MQTFYLMTGISGSGKSTYVAEHFHNANIINPDEIRREMFGRDVVSERLEHLVWSAVWYRIKCALCHGDEDIVFDYTNLSRSERVSAVNRVADEARFEIRKVAVIMKTPVLVALDRNKKRGISDSIVNAMALRQTYPTVAEGFDEVVSVQYDKANV